MDTVHAAQDLLDLSHRTDHLLPHQSSKDECNLSMMAQTELSEDLNSTWDTTQLTDPANSISLTAPADVVDPDQELSIPADQHFMHSVAPERYRDCSSTIDEALMTGHNLADYSAISTVDPFIPDFFQNMFLPQEPGSGRANPRGLLDLNFDLDVDLTDLDLGALDQYNVQFPFVAETPSADLAAPEPSLLEHEGAPERSEAFQRSIWRWVPQQNQDYSAAEQANLALSNSKQNDQRYARLSQQRVITEKVQSASRDRLMALVLGTCRSRMITRIASAFPSADLLDGLLQIALTTPSFDAPSWFHLPTLVPSDMRPELLAALVSAGAMSTTDVALHKLGFAFHEASRISQCRAFEEDNTTIRDLQHVRTFYITLELGMWSGVSRKMEVAECFLQPLVTMLRRGGRFRWSTWTTVNPLASDDQETLDAKWRDWLEQESFLRLLHRVIEFDRQSSMALLKPPLISYSELQLPLPSPQAVWQAKSAVAWKHAYIKHHDAMLKRMSTNECFLIPGNLVRHENAPITSLYLFWGMIWEYGQMSSLHLRSSKEGDANLILSFRREELIKKLEEFRANISHLTKNVEITLEVMLLHLNAPLDEIQVLAGLEGPEEAHRAFKSLSRWSRTQEVRQALWHAGQILRLAEAYPKSLLSEFRAIAAYHAGLMLWSYGLLTRSASGNSTANTFDEATVVLNGANDSSAHRFVTSGSGVPCIQDVRQRHTTKLSDISGVMQTLIELLRSSYVSGESTFVGNLIQLLEGLQLATK